MKTVHEVLSDIQARLNAPKGQYNSFGKYKYRSLEDIQAALKPLLAEHGAYVTNSDEVVMIGERYYVKATATLVAPESDVGGGARTISATSFAREDDSKKGMDASQLTGATSSYARKYAMNALFAIDDTKDADATNTNEKVDGKKTTAKPHENKTPETKTPSVTLEALRVMIEECKTVAEVEDLYRRNNKNKQLDSHPDKQEILSAFQARKRALASTS